MGNQAGNGVCKAFRHSCADGTGQACGLRQYDEAAVKIRARPAKSVRQECAKCPDCMILLSKTIYKDFAWWLWRNGTVASYIFLKGFCMIAMKERGSCVVYI